MKILEVKLMQHTPMIHFQYDQYGATLRASEVKPKLDRFLLTKLGGDGGYEAGCEESKKNGWLVGKGDHPALDYKMKFVADEEAQLTDVKENEIKKFPLLLANNISGKNSSDNKTMYFSMHKRVMMYLYFRNEALYDKLQLSENLPYFFSNTNFGQTSDKGFGSFTACSIREDDQKPVPIIGRKFVDDELYMDICVEQGISDRSGVYSFNTQECLFNVIKNFWRNLKKQIKNDENINTSEIGSMQSYIKQMANEGTDRRPTPIIFKPISYLSKNESHPDKFDLHFSVYIMLDRDMLQRLYHTKGLPVMFNRTRKISDINYAISYIDKNFSFKNYSYKNIKCKRWLCKVGKEKINVLIF